MSTRPLDGRVAVVTGANHGIGAATAVELAASVRRHGLGWGRIVSLTSGGPLGFPGEVSYGAAKAALANDTMSAASELAADGITANVVYPPVTDTARSCACGDPG